MAQTFLNSESTSDFTYVPAPMYDRKTTARTFDTIHDIIRSLSLAQSFLKGEMSQWRIGNRGVKSNRLVKENQKRSKFAQSSDYNREFSHFRRKYSK